LAKTKEELKKMFSTGKKPTGDDFAELIDESVQDLSGLQEKGDYATEEQLQQKADKEYVDTELGKKANSTSLTNKADKTALESLEGKVQALEDEVEALKALIEPDEE